MSESLHMVYVCAECRRMLCIEPHAIGCPFDCTGLEPEEIGATAPRLLEADELAALEREACHGEG